MLLAAASAKHFLMTTKMSSEASLRDIKGCAVNLRSDFNNVKTAITNKDWNSLFKWLANISTTWSECYEAFQQVQACELQVKSTIGSLKDLLSAFKSGSLNPATYINAVKAFIANVDGIVDKCYDPIATSSVKAVIP